MNQKPIYRDGLFLTGIVFILLSTLVFILPQFVPRQPDGLFGIFFIHYAIAAIYLIMLWARGITVLKWKFMRQSVIYYIPFIILALISAYALNRQISVFHVSVNWLSVLLVLQCVNLLLFSIYHMLQKWLKYVMFFILGIGLALFIYLAIYVAPMYILSVLAFIFLGISGHSFVPLFFVIAFFTLYRKFSREDNSIIYPFAAGSLVSLLAGIIFAMQWNNVSKIIDKEYTQSLVNENDLPAWVRISQKLPQNSVTEKVLKAGIVYSVYNENSNIFWAEPGESFGETKKHDPLVVFASVFNTNSEINEKEKIKILESVYDSRHNAQERLWSGENLRIGQVISNIRLWPEYRMAYTEKIISIENTGERNSWRNSEEALFTFHLPEGAVATSLSLWINGKEEKGYLTSKQKADSAYKTIVGVEVRDPALLHWQEGNTVTIRVFPCTPEENRRFKIGITSPLKVEEKELVYQNIYFDGPLTSGAKETRIINTGNAKNYSIPFKYNRNADGNFEHEGNYNAEWKISVPATEITQSSFSFNGKNYSLNQYKEKLVPAQFNKIYLDLNKSWEDDEVEEILAAANGKPIYAWLGKWFEVDKNNYEDMLDDFKDLNFSMFPLYEIKDRQNSLLITKGTPTSPNLRDLVESSFHSGIRKLEEDLTPLKTFSLNSTELSPYIKTLKEFRMIQCENGEMEELKAILAQNVFPEDVEEQKQLLIQPAQILITEQNSSDTAKSGAPDHFFRLFAYNQIMKNAGAKAIHKDFTDTNLVALAQQAYVVSPVSSLVVLESQQDYERFGIEKSKNSLGNASMKSSGAVPEPHEWALIFLVLLTLSGFLFGEKLKKAWKY